MKSVGGISAIGAPLSPDGIGQDNFVRRIGDRFVSDFHETGGKTVRNLVGKGDSGSFGNNPTWQRKNLNFDGKDDFINYSHDTDLDISDELTLVIYANPADRSGAPQILLSKANYEMREYDDEYIWQALGVNIDWTKSGDVGDEPWGLCVYDGKLYVACGGSNDVYVFDGSTWIKSGDVGTYPWGLCVYDGKLYVSCAVSNDVYVYDGANWVKSGDVGTWPDGLCVYDGKLYVACGGSDDVYVFDGSTWIKSGDVGDNPWGLCIYDGKLYVSCAVSDDIYVFDGANWVKSGDVGDGSWGLCVYNGKLYVACGSSDDIYVFDGANWVKSGDVGIFPEGLCVYDGKLYVTCDGSDDIYVFDGANWVKSGDVGIFPEGLCVYDGKLYVTCDGSDDIYVFGSGRAIRKDKPSYPNLIAGYYRSNEIGISRNGEQFSTASHTLTLSSPLLDLHIGKGYGSSQSGLFGGNDEQLEGSISFVRINASVLSEIQVLQDYLYTKWRN